MPTAQDSANPLLAPWNTPYQLPPFDQVRPEHFLPAFSAAFAAHEAEIAAIADDPAPPSFENTAAALDRAGALLERIELLFSNLCTSHTSPELQAVQREAAPLLAAHDSKIYLNAKLFARLDAVHAQRATLNLSGEQLRLLERKHLDFVRAGAKLQGDTRARFAQIVQRLAQLYAQFGQNVLADENGFKLILKTEEELAGLPAALREAAKQAAITAGQPDAWAITLSRSMWVPFLSHSPRRDLREQLHQAHITRGMHDGEHDNRPLVKEMLALRLEQAQLLGYTTFADYALVDRMAGTPAAAQDLMQQVWVRAKEKAASDLAQIRALMQHEGHNFAVQPWDWRYYAEKVRQRNYQLDDAEVKPYFPLENMVSAVFDCAQKLFGVRMVKQPQIKAYHPDVDVYEVRETIDGNDQLIGLFLHDNFARPSKRSGAWMSLLRHQHVAADGTRVLPVALNNNNFAKGTPTLLSLDDVRTLFHEFGHGLHGLLSNVRYKSLSGPNVMRDFVELPSQLFEHWLMEPAVIRRHARHVETGAPIPEELIERIRAARLFNQSYETSRYVASALVDMAAHGLTDYSDFDPVAFEQSVCTHIGALREVGLMHRLPHFQHLFSGDYYAAGYYVYLWAQVLDADAYNAFEERNDPFDADTAARLRKFIYSSGNSLEPMQAYRAYRGRDATIEPMLKKNGLLEPSET
ncbi:MAG: M3 family metallopeptidase [Burkholderiaceae bacterium]